MSKNESDEDRPGRSEDVAFYRLLLARVPDAVFRYRLFPRPKFEYMSPAIASLTGYSPEEYYADPKLVLKASLPEDRALILRAMHDPTASDVPTTLRLQRKDGSVIWAEHRLTPLTDEHGRAVAIDGVVRDVTGRVESELRLKAHEDRFSSMAEATTVGLVTADGDGTITFINAAGAKMLGYDAPKDLIGKSIFIFVPQNAHARMGEMWARAKAAGGFPPSTRDVQAVRRDGTTFPAEVSFCSWVQAGEVHHGAVVRDLSERQRYMDRERLAFAALTSAANGVVITDVAGAIQWTNPAFTKMTGYSAEEVMGHNPRFLKSGKHNQEFYKRLWDTVVAGEVWSGVVTNRKRDGTLYTEEQTITPVRDEQGRITHFVAIKLDVTSRQVAQEQVTQKLREVAALNRMFQQQFAQRDELSKATSRLAQSLNQLAGETEQVAKQVEAIQQMSDPGRTLG